MASFNCSMLVVAAGSDCIRVPFLRQRSWVEPLLYHWTWGRHWGIDEAHCPSQDYRRLVETSGLFWTL